MRFDERHFGEPAAVGNSHDPSAAVISGDVFQQPVDCIVGIRAFINGMIVFRTPHRALEHELAFRLVAAPDVLEDQEVAVARQFAHSRVDGYGSGAPRQPYGERSIRNGSGPHRCTCGEKDDRVKVDAVPRRNHVFALLVARRDVGGAVSAAGER